MAKSDMVGAMDDYVAGRELFDRRLTEGMANHVDGWHRLIVQVQCGAISAVQVQSQEDVRLRESLDKASCVN